MPTIYVSDKEFEALAFLVSVAQNTSESATDETYLNDFNYASKQYSHFERKYYASKRNQNKSK